MELCVLVDNSAFTDSPCIGEAGFSLSCSGEGFSGLFDLGFSDCIVKNAHRVGVDLLEPDFIAFSHGHADHTWGLGPLLFERFLEQQRRGALSPLTFYGHPDAFLSRTMDPFPEAGMLIGPDRLRAHGTVVATREPVFIRDDLVFLGEVPVHEPAAVDPYLRKRLIRRPEGLMPDFIRDDSALVWQGGQGLVVMTGCSHSGILPIVDRACELCGEDRVQDIIGGFHLYRTPDEQIQEIGKGLVARGVMQIHPCHCTGDRAVRILSGYVPVCETGAGMRLSYE